MSYFFSNPPSRPANYNQSVPTSAPKVNSTSEPIKTGPPYGYGKVTDFFGFTITRPNPAPKPAIVDIKTEPIEKPPVTATTNRVNINLNQNHKFGWFW